MLKITEYAQRLIDDLDTVDFYRAGQDPAEELDRPLHRRGGELQDHRQGTSSPSTPPGRDTLFGATYMVIAPGASPHVKSGRTSWPTTMKRLKTYQRGRARKSDFERTELVKEKTGVQLKGVRAINPVNGKEIPIFISDYVLCQLRHRRHHGRSRPRHPGLGVRQDLRSAHDRGRRRRERRGTRAPSPMCETGVMVNSGFLTGLSVEDAKAKP